VTWLARLYIWATYRLYHELAWAYDVVSWLVSLGRWSGWRRKALDYVVGQRVLEVGFGTGELLVEMAGRDLAAIGLDSSLAMHRVAARKLSWRHVDVPRLQGLVQAMPFADEQFDSVLCTFPAGYILEAQTLVEVARMLRPRNPVTGDGGGRLVVVGMVVWTDDGLWRRATQFLFGVGGEAVVDRFQRLAEAAGLQVWVADHGGPGLRVPVVLAERCGPNPAAGALDARGEQGGGRDDAYAG
jgi:ubiquinone/menaquinone biosynthesis C-methylase UbiE